MLFAQKYSEGVLPTEPCLHHNDIEERVCLMISRRLFIGFMLLLHAAFSLLGNAGTHAVLGCQHDHQPTPPSAVTKSVPHQHRGCQHAHCHSHNAPSTPDADPHSLPPLTDDDCAVCQFFTSPIETEVAFQWTPWIEGIASTCVEVSWQRRIEFQSVYEVRGPPALIEYRSLCS